ATAFKIIQLADDIGDELAATKFWLGDFALTQVKESEQKAKEAKTRFDAATAKLGAIDADAAKKIRTGGDDFMAALSSAAEARAKTDDAGVRSWAAKARDGGKAADSALKGVLERNGLTDSTAAEVAVTKVVGNNARIVQVGVTAMIVATA